jgi:hypothetical protein
MKTERFHDLSRKAANEIHDTASEFMAVAGKLFCIVRGFLDDAPADNEDICMN